MANALTAKLMGITKQALRTGTPKEASTQEVDQIQAVLDHLAGIATTVGTPNWEMNKSTAMQTFSHPTQNSYLLSLLTAMESAQGQDVAGAIKETKAQVTKLSGAAAVGA